MTKKTHTTDRWNDGPFKPSQPSCAEIERSLKARTLNPARPTLTGYGQRIDEMLDHDGETALSLCRAADDGNPHHD